MGDAARANRPTTAIRTPLQSGASSVAANLYTTMWGCILVAFFSRDLGDLLWPAVGIGIAVIGGINLYKVRALGASDLVFDARGIRVVGGFRHGVTIAWDELDAPRSLVAERWKETRKKDGTLERMLELAQLVVARRGADAVVIARVSEETELPSLRVILDELRAAKGETRQVTPAPEKAIAPVVASDTLAPLRCRSCGAPATPADEDVVSCAFCPKAVPVPEEIRRRVRTMNELGAAQGHARRAVQRLVDQPTPLRTNLILVALAAGFLSAPCFTAWLLMGDMSRDRGPVAISAAIAGLALAAAWMAAGLVWVERRNVLQRRLVELCAHPIGLSSTMQCRACGGALPRPGESALVRCIYCDCENLLTVDLRPAHASTTAQVRSVTAVLAEREGEIRASAIGMGVLLGIAGIATGFARSYYTPG